MTRILAAALLALTLVACGGRTVVVDAATLAGPNHALTPGVVDPAHTAAVVCHSSTKPWRTATQAQKDGVYRAYGIDVRHHSVYVLDDLVPLEVGGMNVPGNLWPQPKAEAAVKDRLENRLHADVCAGRITLAAAQAQMLAYPGHP